jgi:integrase/recombinase XerD
MSKTISPLRQRMVDDMKLGNMSPATQGAYIRAVKNLSLYFGLTLLPLRFLLSRI